MKLPKNAKRLTNEIELWVIPNFASTQECQEIIDEANNKGFDKSLVDDPKKHNLPEGRIADKGRTSSTCFLTPKEAPTITKVSERTKAIIGNYKLEGLQVQRYENTQRYDPHYDTFDNVDEDEQRNYTAMLYLNDVPKGGATLFKNLNIRIQPTAGTLVIWNNLLPNGCKDTNTLHAGEPVTDGIKYITTFWFRKNKGEFCNIKKIEKYGNSGMCYFCIFGFFLFLVIIIIIVVIVKKKPKLRIY